jgi:CheY-like chemotaxis protein
VDQQQPNSNLKKHILVAEDEESLRNLYRDLLVGEGYDVVTAEDGQQALYQMQKGGFDLVLLDIIMPSLDGLNVLQKLQEQPAATPNKTVIIMSNLGQESVIAKGVSLGVQGYFIKSEYTPDQFIQVVRGYLDQK